MTDHGLVCASLLSLTDALTRCQHQGSGNKMPCFGAISEMLEHGRASGNASWVILARSFGLFRR